MENSYIVCDFEDDFHATVLKSIPSGIDLPYIKITRNSYSGIMEMIWSTVNNRTGEYLKNNDNLIGFIIPGFFQDKLNTDFFALLDSLILPRLLNELDSDSKSIHPLNKYEKATLKLIASIISSELGWQYDGLFSNGLSHVFKEVPSEEDLYNLSNDKLMNLLFSKDSVDRYVSSSYLRSIDRLNNYVITFNIDDLSSRKLRMITPLLHQCIGEDDIAYDLLSESSITPDSLLKTSSYYLLSLFRAVSRTRYSDREKLVNIMVQIWNNNIIPGALVDTLKNITSFFRELSNEIPQRFQEESLQAIIDNANGDDKDFYSSYKYLILVSDDVKSLSVISPFLFENLAVVNRFEQYLIIIQNKSLRFSTRLYALSCFTGLLRTVASHIAYNPRISAKACLQYLIDGRLSELEIKEQFPWYSSIKNEIFYVYSYSQQASLKSFSEQIESLGKELPSFLAVQRFEKIIFDGDKKYTNEIENIRAELASHSNALITHAKDIADINKDLQDSSIIIGHLLKFIINNETASHTLFEVFSEQIDLTKEFCDCIHDILKNNTSLSKEKKQSLENLYSLLDEVISNPEMHYKKASEKCFKDGISAFVDAFPGGSNVKAAIKVVQKIRQATEYKSKEEKEKTGFDDEFFKQHPNYET